MMTPMSRKSLTALKRAQQERNALRALFTWYAPFRCGGEPRSWVPDCLSGRAISNSVRSPGGNPLFRRHLAVSLKTFATALETLLTLVMNVLASVYSYPLARLC